jgi:beta-lactamase superfamily II metal-dependent hydrolase
MKISHHGHIDSTSPSLIAALEPQNLIVPSGWNRSLGIPRYGVFQRISNAVKETNKSANLFFPTFPLYCKKENFDP